MLPLGIVGLLNLMLAAISILTQAGLKFQGNPEMWEIIKKFLALIQSFRDWLTQRKQEEIKKMEEAEIIAKKEIDDEYQKAKKTLEESGYSGDAFDDALDRVRELQQEHNKT